MTTTFVQPVNHEVKGFTKNVEGEWKGPYVFIFATDPQPGLIDMVEGGNGSKWQTEINRTEMTCTAINNIQPRPKFVVIGGDIVDAFPGTQYRQKQVEDIMKAFSTLDVSIPMFAVSGNHDVGNIPTQETMEIYKRDFGEDYYCFWLGGVFYIVINTQCIFNPSQAEELCSEQDSWLEQQLLMAKNSSCKHVVVFMHIPLFIKHADEDDSYFSIPRERRIAMLEQFADAGIKKVFSGHYHRNAGGGWSKTNADGSVSKVEIVVTTAIGAQLGNDEAGICIVKVLEDEISHHFYPISEIPASLDI